MKVKGRRKRPLINSEKFISSPKPRTMSEQPPLKPESWSQCFMFLRRHWHSVSSISGIQWRANMTPSTAHMKQLLDYMNSKYGVDDIQHSGPFLIPRSDKVLSQEMRPLTIGGPFLPRNRSDRLHHSRRSRWAATDKSQRLSWPKCIRCQQGSLIALPRFLSWTSRSYKGSW